MLNKRVSFGAPVVRFGRRGFRLQFTEVTTGATLYLVSACGSAEEFVAAFRRYADRTGLFIPSSAPLPAGRRGRLALTLKDGGVMIEGEAEILQSSAKPTVLHGRPGMTVKFIAADDASKIVIAELEKARLAMKPAPPSVPPRPSDVPAEPRPIVPAVGGRIDAANALAECVVIGDAAQLVDTASAPRSINDVGSGKAKFTVPSIPGVGAPRAHTPSTPPPSRPNTPSTPPPSGVPTPIGASPSGSTLRAKTPSIPPDPASKPLPRPAPATIPPSTRLTSVGFPAIDKLPAFPAKTNVPGAPAAPRPLAAAATPPAENPLVQAPPNRSKETPAQPAENPLLATKLGTKPAERVVNATTLGIPALDKPPGERAISVSEESTTIGEVPPTPPKKTDPMPAQVASTTPSPTPAPAQPASGPTPAPPKLPSEPTSASVKAQRLTSIGFPAVRTPFETQPVGVVRPPGSPQPPVVPGDGASAKSGAASPGPRGKNPTRPPLTPRHPTPAAPVPIVRSPARAAPLLEDAIVESIEEEEKTDLSDIPQAPRSTAAFATADMVDARVDPLAQTLMSAQRSGGMRASEILAAIPSDDWTMSPDASGPTVLPSSEKPAVIESTKAPKGPPTGNWSISLDPEVGWSEPVKLEKSEQPKPAPKPAKAPKKREPGQGNPDKAVADEKGFTAVEWEEKPTGIGEAKIEIDSTLMEPLKPMPVFDDDADPLSAPPSAGDRNTGPRANVPITYITPPSGMPAMQAGPPASGGLGLDRGSRATGPSEARDPGPNPFEAPPTSNPFAAAPPSGAYPAAGAYVPAAQTLPGTPPPMNAPYAQGMPAARSQLNAPAPGNPNAQFGSMAFPQQDYSGATAAKSDAARRKRTTGRSLLIGAGAIAALAGGFVLVLLLVGGKAKKATPATTTKPGSGSARAVAEHADANTPSETGSSAIGSNAGSAEHAVGSGSGSDVVAEPGGSGSGAVAAVDTPVDAGVEDKPPVVEGGPCNVAIASVPNGADVYQADKKVGTTPFSLEMPCGIEAKLTLRKAKFINTARSFTPADGKGNKVVVKLAKTTFTLKVTSSPAGATINVGGRSMGVTPATIRLPAYEAAAIMVTKPGYASDSKTVTPKSNNISHHVVLKKGRR